MLIIQVSKEQAAQFANAIYGDIKDYIQNHQEELAKYAEETGEENQ